MISMEPPTHVLPCLSYDDDDDDDDNDDDD